MLAGAPHHMHAFNAQCAQLITTEKPHVWISRNHSGADDHRIERPWQALTKDLLLHALSPAAWLQSLQGSMTL